MYLIIFLSVVDLIADMYGENEQLNQLVIAFIEAGKIQQARKIIEVRNLFTILML